ncbi:MAG: hypothetical protein AAGI25_12250 [Bacteroidota bacterium]
MKFYKLISKKQAWASLLLIAAVSFTIFSCSDDDTTVIATEGVEAESAWVASFVQESPSGDIPYITVFETAPAEVTVTNSVELGANTRVDFYGSNVYTMDENAKTITKWDVNKSTLELEPESILSYASTGMAGEYLPFVFLSDDQAFIINVNEGIILDWNPASMEISEVIDVQPNPLNSIDPEADSGTWKAYVVNNKIIIPIEYSKRSCCEFINPEGATIGIYDPINKAIEYKYDNRLLSGKADFKEDTEGNYYHTPLVYNYWASEYFNDNSLPRHTVLKIGSDGNYDSTSGIVLDDLLPLKVTREAVYVSGDNLILAYFNNDWEVPAWDDRYSVFSHVPEMVSINMNTLEVQPFTAFEGYTSVNQAGVIDGIIYLWGFQSQSGVDNTKILREDSFGNYTEITSLKNGWFSSFGKLW